jgi:uncharacterized protein YxeA
MKKILVGILIVLMLLLPSAVALPEITAKNNDVIKYQKKGSEKPDLIVHDFWVEHMEHIEGYNDFHMRIQNVGDATIDKNEDIFVKIDVKKFSFSKLKLVNYKNYHFSMSDHIDDLLPGGTKDKDFDDDLGQYEPGIYIFDCTVNPDRTIDEKLYINNDRTELVIGIWLILTRWYTYKLF